jgi:rhamnulokinase
LGLVGSLAEAREVVRQSFDVRRYEPRETEQWHDGYGKFCGLLS